MWKPSVRLTITCTSVLILAMIAGATDEQRTRVEIQSPKHRSLAPAFVLLDASGKQVRLSDYRGKVVLLDFWATACGGCKIEIPWYMEFERTYKGKGLAVVGVSMDILYEDLRDADEGWRRVNPFVKTNGVTYPILMGDNRVTQSYAIKSLPATYLIDAKGRVATSYVGVLADKSNVESNIRNLLMEH